MLKQVFFRQICTAKRTLYLQVCFKVFQKHDMNELPTQDQAPLKIAQTLTAVRVPNGRFFRSFTTTPSLI